MWYEYLYIGWLLFFFGFDVYLIARYLQWSLQEKKRRQDVCADCPFFPIDPKKERREGARRATE